MQVFEDHQQRLDLAFAQQQALHRLQGSPTALLRIKQLPLRVVSRHLQQREQRRQTAFQRPVQGQSFPGHLLANRARAVAVLNRKVALEEIDHRLIGGRLAVRDRAGLENLPAMNTVRVGDFPDQA